MAIIRLDQNVPIVDDNGKPTFTYHVWWDKFAQSLEQTIVDVVNAALTANWSGVIDDNGKRPEDDATLGANLLTNVTNANLDNLPDGATYVRLPGATTTGTGASRRALIDFTQGHSNKSLANIDSAANTKLTGIETGATVGAAWGTNLTGRPTELTDGRVSTALNSSGRLIKASNVFSAGVIGLRSTTTATLTGTDAGTSATISVNAHSRKFGDVSTQTTVSYNAGSITGLSYSTRYFVYCDDTTYSGGAVTYVATTDLDTPAARAGRVYVGECTTPASGGAATSGTAPGSVSGSGLSAIP